jgi:carboxylesterase type B
MPAYTRYTSRCDSLIPLSTVTKFSSTLFNPNQDIDPYTMLQSTVFSGLVSLAISFLATPALSTSLPRKTQDNPTVQVLNGTYSGVHSPEFNQDFFLGMPYSQAPVGDLRFRTARSLNTSWTGTRNATEYSLECIGYGSDQWVLGNMISEDCLTLNVIRPSGQTGKALPVGVWIHGGGFTEGGNADPRYNLSFIVQQSTEMNIPFIGVSINYRLQAWGFIFGTEIAQEGSTNLGVRDQRLALHWIQENIAAFGGDPSQVTIWGESAGGFSIGSQLVAYGGRDDGCE